MHWTHKGKEDPERSHEEKPARLDKGELDKLRQEGFTDLVIARLYRLRSQYVQTEMDQAPLDMHRLEFARWLVETGRLTDQIK